MALLANKTAVITGGNSGIGYATAADFLEKGAKVLITGRKPDAVQRAVHDLGNAAEGFTADQSSLEDAKKLAAYVHSRYGKIDILFVNAGVGKFVPLESATEAEFDEIMDINFKGAFFTVQALLPLLNEGGTIILLSSINAYLGMPGAAIYGASKAALNSLGRTLARELAPRKIRVNIVNPGPVDTPIFSKTGVPEEEAKAMQAKVVSGVPVGRIGRPEEVARLVSFLASDEATYINGGEYTIDGGALVHPLIL
ncbi:glucose 1-dehydrogenase [Chitinophaga nivalis]|uniref:Glucose 1-dehydrogenase n=1 Tax=Chitinophaga nivalis TaxID=2991709 RepID=A0ABT3IPG1_9BACT|nr:glucose 1-dehydrogenase [Chitinophaga nivalis]MCW3464447.1 glucose 1-dehydrogenase [Chitinophaga nivalis]MCW3485862.1 glucose 1-dehydrogenase [Chitinophaga nivalis]